MRDARVLLEDGEKVGERRPLDDGELLENHLATLEERENRGRARARGNFVGSGLHPRRTPVQAQIPLHRARIVHTAGRLEPRQHVAQAEPGLDVDARADGSGSWRVVSRSSHS